MSYINSAETERLLIRPLTRSDINDWKKFIESDKATKYFALDKKIGTQQLTSEWIENQLRRYKENLYGLMALIEKSSNKLIGQCGLLSQEIEGKTELEVGYHLLPEHWGKGYATEAAKFFKEFAFGKGLSNSIVSIIHVDNIRSQRVAEKNGMKRTIRSEFKDKPVYIYRIDITN